MPRQFNGNLARFGREQRAANADKIGQIKMLENFPKLIAQNIFLRINLDAPALVAHVNEHGFAHVAVRGDAARHGHFAAFGVVFPRVGAGFGRRELVFERVNAFGPQSGELGFALFDE